MEHLAAQHAEALHEGSLKSRAEQTGSAPASFVRLSFASAPEEATLQEGFARLAAALRAAAASNDGGADL